LRAHFDSVSGELRNRDVAELSASQRASRAVLIAWLQEYRDAGRFPVNDRFPAATPIFRDPQGTLCAMAYLIDRSGGGDLVDRVAGTRNTEYIARLADDPDLVAWLDGAGLSLAEAARIQPAYDYDNDSDEVPPGYTMASIVTSGDVSGNDDSNALGAASIVIGGAALMAGGIRLSKPRDAHASSARVEIVPTIIPVADRPRVGLTVNARF
jgi:hypothetical protein